MGNERYGGDGGRLGVAGRRGERSWMGINDERGYVFVYLLP